MSDGPLRGLTDHAAKNLVLWDRSSDEYERRHGGDLGGQRAMSWGLWRIPESSLRILGDVAGKDILELGCGAARWSIELARLGARPVGLDLSERQLSHARRLVAESELEVPLVHASAESVPLPDEAFDIVFCDWGAMTFCDPRLTVPEVARLLRPAGLFAFATSTPVQFMCRDRRTDHIGVTLLNDYFGLHRIEWEDEVNFQLTYGEWIHLFRTHGLEVIDLVETRPPVGVETSYQEPQEIEWARRWPMENIWRLRKFAT